MDTPDEKDAHINVKVGMVIALVAQTCETHIVALRYPKTFARVKRVVSDYFPEIDMATSTLFRNRHSLQKGLGHHLPHGPHGVPMGLPWGPMGPRRQMMTQPLLEGMPVPKQSGRSHIIKN